MSLISQYFGSSALPGPPSLALQPQIRNDSTAPPSPQLGRLHFLGKLKSRFPPGPAQRSPGLDFLVSVKYSQL